MNEREHLVRFLERLRLEVNEARREFGGPNSFPSAEETTTTFERLAVWVVEEYGCNPPYFDAAHGICWAVNHWAEQTMPDKAQTFPLLEGATRTWPEHSGHSRFPVPSADKGVSHKDHYDDSRPGRMWLTGDYAAARMRLLDHIINELREVEHEAE